VDLRPPIGVLFVFVHARTLVQVVKILVIDQRITPVFKDSPRTIPPVGLSIMAIFQNEAGYLAEWIEYYFHVEVASF
jgi:predicted membrane chloride channel (bestrophin family)